MIKFFRKIRQKLLSENKFSKYLLYAIGEIILVVIGILIAIQLNNFNEKKKNENNGKQILAKLKQEINQDIVYLDSLSSEYTLWQTQAQYILDSVYGKVSKIERLNQISIGRGTMNYLHLNKSTYNELLNSGDKIEIENKDLKNKIVLFFQETDVELYKLNLDNERLNQWLYNKMDVALWHRLWANRNLKYEDWSWLQDPSSERFRDGEAATLFFQNAIIANLSAISTFKSKSQNLMELIEKELSE